MTAAPTLRYLSAAHVREAMPPLPERLALAARTMRALAGDAQLPPKIGVQPRQTGSLAHAMPALVRGPAGDGSADLFGMKWIVGFPGNARLGLPTYSALVLVNDAETGAPVGVLDGGPITAQRTAAISGVAIRSFAPGGRGHARVALLGAGVQAHAHVPVIGHVLGGAEVAIVDRDVARADELVNVARATEGIASAERAEDVRRAVGGADVVVSVISFGPDRQALDPAWLTSKALFVAVDYDMEAPAGLAREALFVVDDRPQFLATRDDAVFAGYPDPDLTLGEALRAATPPPAGRVLVSHLGVGLADVVFAAAILDRARELGLGLNLPR